MTFSGIAIRPAVRQAQGAVQAALRGALRLPERDRTLRPIEHSASHFSVPPGRGPRYALIEITLFSARSLAAKRALFGRIVRNLARSACRHSISRSR
jgi:hypothetical protein